MGRTVIAEDGIECYGQILAEKKELVVGLIFGQEISATKSCVIHIARTPAAEEPEEEDEEGDETPASKKEPSNKSPTDDFDDSLVLDHARQVMRSLPGGITILGLFIVSAADPFQNSGTVSRLRKLLTSVDLTIGKSCVTLRQQLTCERVVLHLSNTTMKYNCKTVDIASPVASPKPAEWKFVSSAGSPWIELHCTLNVEFFIALSNAESAGTLRNQLDAGVELYSKAVKQCVCLFDGKIPAESELLDAGPVEKSGGGGKKKQSKQSSNSIEERMKTLNVQILIPEPEVKQEKQDCSSDLRFGGQMCIKAYCHGKATVREACQVIKEDILRSLWARCDMHCDSLIGEEQRGQPDVRAVLHEPPRRVLAPLPFSPISVSDYLFPGEGPVDSLASLADLLDLGTLLEGDVQDYWEAAAEVNEAVLDADNTTLDTTSATTPTLLSPMAKQSGSVTQSMANSRAILLSGLIALLAIVLSYLALHVFRSN